MIIKNKLLIKLTLYIIGITYFAIIPIIFYDSRYVISVIINSSILSCISLGVWLIFVIGRANIGQAAFVGIGGYVTAILLTKLDLSFWISFPLSGIIAALLSLMLGFVLLRLKGIYFSMITLTLTKLMNLVFLNAGFITNGGSGILNVPKPEALTIGSIAIIPSFRGEHGNILFYYLVAFTLLICVYGTWKLYNSRIGLILRSLRQSETLAQSVGINVVKYRILAYTICGFFGGLGGSLFMVYIQSIFPETFGVGDSFYYMVYCYLGGLGYVFGPVIGSFVLPITFELLRSIQQYQELIYSLIIIAFILWLPNGILSLNINSLNLYRKINKRE
ncbi:MAG: branched-chain amino acid ABC transporter permease [Atribacterota bacterium]|nr:branched-chain amino acid ABC transporter permease [Atribacterota bacterium]